MAFNPFNSKLTSVERLVDGSWYYSLFGGGKSRKGYTSERQKLETVLCNPAYLTIVKLQCDIFSLGKIKAVLNDKVKPNDPLIDHLKNPNPFQSARQFLWDFMFWKMLGTSYMYSSSKLIKDSTNTYWLNPACIVWDEKTENKLGSIVLSNRKLKELEDTTIKYDNLNGTYTNYRLGDIKCFFDLTNNSGNWYKGHSVIDALYKIIRNSDTALDSKYANLDFAGKYMVSGINTMDNINETPMPGSEKRQISDSLKGPESVHVLKTPIEIKRFVENISKLELDKSYFASVYKIGKIYNIPKDVIEAYLEKGSTFENQKESKAGWVEQSLMPAAQDLAEGIQKHFGYEQKNTEITIDYKDLSFMQVFEKQRQERVAREITNINTAKEMGAITEEEASAKVKEIMGYE